MENTRKMFFGWTGWALLVAGSVFIRLISDHSGWVESNYSNGLYPDISVFYRRIFGWIPFSMGDLLYVGAGIWLIFFLYRKIKKIYQRDYSARSFRTDLLKGFSLVLFIYFLFNFNWGLNYNRQGIARQLSLDVRLYPVDTLNLVTGLLLEKANYYRSFLPDSQVLNPRDVMSKAENAFQQVQASYPFLKYRTASIKPSLYGVIGNYIGYMGYYNPFTGEAQVNTNVPSFTIPYVSCHEIAHQLGYAKENEANFVGYLAASGSKDTSFLYSVYFDLFLYANSELYSQDTAAARKYFRKMSPLVASDYSALRAFSKKYETVIDRMVSWFYDHFLRLNQQPEGRRTYGKVITWLMAFYAKNHRL